MIQPNTRKAAQISLPSPVQGGDCFRSRVSGFTLIELLAVIAVIGILASLLLPALGRVQSRAQGVICLNNTKQLSIAWTIYSYDNAGRLAYNLAMTSGKLSAASSAKTNLNWVNNVMDWELNPDNTNSAGITEASLGNYAKSLKIYRCPSDVVLSEVQKKAGWSQRVRSYSMNAMVGDAGAVSQSGHNVNNPNYTQFFSMSAIPHPADIFVFLDEHPDSIDDGYFLNKEPAGGYYSSAEWIDLPASYHNEAAAFSFADGHGELHRWMSASTRRPSLPMAAQLPALIKKSDTADFNWVLSHMSIDSD